MTYLRKLLLVMFVLWAGSSQSLSQEQALEDPNPVFGSAEPALRMLVFTDYNCPYCKRLEPHLQRLLSDYPDLQVVNIIVPLRQRTLAGSDVNSAEFALNVWHHDREKFTKVHELLYAKTGMHTAQSLQQIAERTDTETQLVARDVNAQIISMNYGAFQEIGLRGTPSIIIGKQLIPGYVEYETLKEVLEQQLDD